MEGGDSKYRERSQVLYAGTCENIISMEKTFWNELYRLKKNNDNENFKEWLVNLLVHLERKMKKITKVKREKLQKL